MPLLHQRLYNIMLINTVMFHVFDHNIPNIINIRMTSSYLRSHTTFNVFILVLRGPVL